MCKIHGTLSCLDNTVANLQFLEKYFVIVSVYKQQKTRIFHQLNSRYIKQIKWAIHLVLNRHMICMRNNAYRKVKESKQNSREWAILDKDNLLTSDIFIYLIK